MDKLDLTTPDISQENLSALAALFPSCITESADKNGNIKKSVNFSLLKQLLGGNVTDDAHEHYEFTWVGKRQAMAEAAKPTTETLRPDMESSRDWDTTQNLYIEGDNLTVLKILQESYLGKVKMIYIDPPYNTGHDFIYNDHFEMDKQNYEGQIGLFDEEGYKQFDENPISNPRFHSDWCSMIYARLLLARNLLSDDGVIFISIDDNECANLIKTCEEVFGADCFVADISWQRTYSTRNDSKGIVREVEHLVVFSKQVDWQPNKLPRTDEMNSIYKNPDNDVEPWTSDNPFAPGASTHQGMVYAIQHPFTGEMIYPSTNACWRYQQDEMLRIMKGWGKYELRNLHDEEKRAAVCGIEANAVRKDVLAIVLSVSLDEARAEAQKRYDAGKWPKFYFTKDGQGGIRRKTYLSAVGGKLPTNFWPYSDVGHTDEAKKEIMTLFDGNAPFDTPKPVRLLDRILTIATDKDSLVLDFFSGSATTAHAVMKKNESDGGTRQFILVQLPEKSPSPQYDTLCDVGKERIRRAGDKIKEEAGLTAQGLDIGFRVFHVDSSNMKDVYYYPEEISQMMLGETVSNIKEGRTDLDLLYSCLLDWGVEINLPHTSAQVAGCTVHNVDNGALMACFDENVPTAVVEEMAKQKPIKAVFRDSSFATDADKINVTEIFKNLSPDTKVKVI